MSLNTRLNEWIDGRDLDPTHRLLIGIGTIALILALPVIVAIVSAYPDAEAVTRYGNWATIVSALVLVAIAGSRLLYVNRQR